MKLPILIMATAMALMLTLLAGTNNPDHADAVYLAPRQELESRHIRLKDLYDAVVKNNKVISISGMPLYIPWYQLEKESKYPTLRGYDYATGIETSIIFWEPPPEVIESIPLKGAIWITCGWGETNWYNDSNGEITTEAYWQIVDCADFKTGDSPKLPLIPEYEDKLVDDTNWVIKRDYKIPDLPKLFPQTHRHHLSDLIAAGELMESILGQPLPTQITGQYLDPSQVTSGYDGRLVGGTGGQNWGDPYVFKARMTPDHDAEINTAIHELAHYYFGRKGGQRWWLVEGGANFLDAVAIQDILEWQTLEDRLHYLRALDCMDITIAQWERYQKANGNSYRGGRKFQPQGECGMWGYHKGEMLFIELHLTPSPVRGYRRLARWLKRGDRITIPVLCRAFIAKKQKEVIDRYYGEPICQE